MNKILTLALGLIFALNSYAAAGDTTVVRSHNKQHMKFPPSDRLYSNRVKFPDGTKKYRKIFLDYTLECPTTGCSTWDYDTHVAVLDPTGTYDSTLTQYPFFKVDSMEVDSFYISMTPTYVTFFDTIGMMTDSMMSDTVLIQQFLNSSNPSQVTNSFYAFNTGYYKYYFNSSGTIIDSVYENGDSIWYQQHHDVYTVFEVKNVIEIGRLITPYGEPSGIDYYPYTYRFDITDYATILTDSTDIRLQFSGWQDGFLATLDFIFIEGTPPRDPKRVINLDDGYFAYGKASDPINAKLSAYDLKLESGESSAQLNYTVTGHGADNYGCSEFCAKSYYVKVNGSTKYSKQVWDEDCGENPIYPQGGTWIYDRANWCPGLPGYTDHHDLTPYVNNSTTTEIKVEFQNHTTSGGSQPGYNINGHIITYGPMNYTTDAALKRVIAPNDEFFENRYNPICNKPMVEIQNLGSDALTALKITYGVKGGQNSVYNWTGNLDFQASEKVELPAPDWSRSANSFEVTISEPNGKSDENAFNNSLTTTFETPDILPNTILITYRTNGTSSVENILSIEDADGNSVWVKDNVANNTLYNDTITLVGGCYHMRLTDQGEDGLYFFASSQGNGSLLFRDPSNNKTLKTFQRDFGSVIDYHFMVGWGVGIQTEAKEPEIFVYPNPSEGLVYVEGFTVKSGNFIEIYDASGKVFRPTAMDSGDGRIQLELPGDATGIYILRIAQDQKVAVKRIIRY